MTVPQLPATPTRCPYTFRPLRDPQATRSEYVDRELPAGWADSGTLCIALAGPKPPQGHPRRRRIDPRAVPGQLRKAPLRGNGPHAAHAAHGRGRRLPARPPDLRPGHLGRRAGAAEVLPGHPRRRRRRPRSAARRPGLARLLPRGRRDHLPLRPAEGAADQHLPLRIRRSAATPSTSCRTSSTCSARPARDWR